jgi:hypothetical protein
MYPPYELQAHPDLSLHQSPPDPRMINSFLTGTRRPRGRGSLRGSTSKKQGIERLTLPLAASQGPADASLMVPLPPTPFTPNSAPSVPNPVQLLPPLDIWTSALDPGSSSLYSSQHLYTLPPSPGPDSAVYDGVFFTENSESFASSASPVMISPKSATPSEPLLSSTIYPPARKLVPVPDATHTHNSREQTALDFLEKLRKARITPLELLSMVLNEENDLLVNFRSSFYKESGLDRLKTLLNSVWANTRGQQTLKEWMLPHAIPYICNLIYDEMEDAKPKLHMTIGQVTPEFVNNWDISAIMEAVRTPIWDAVLDAATETRQAKSKDKGSRSRNRVVVTNETLAASL